MLSPLLMVFSSSIMHTRIRRREAIDRAVPLHRNAEEAVGLALFVAGGEFGEFVLGALLAAFGEELVEE